MSSPGERRCFLHEAPMPCPRCHVEGEPTDLDEALPPMHHLVRPQLSRRTQENPT